MKEATIGAKIVMALLFGALVWGGIWGYGYFFPAPIKKAAMLAVNDLPPLTYDKNANAPLRALPDTNTLSDIPATEIRAALMGWNAQAGVLAANGGAFTMKGSIMEENGVRLHLICQNDCNKQGQELYAFAQDYKGGNTRSSKGYNMIAWMGDGCPSYLAGLNKQITEQLGADYIVQAFAAFGSSFGEDKFIFDDTHAKARIKQDPKTALKGSLVIGVLRDGDWNIAMKFADMNQILVNNDESTYDPDAMNWIGIDDYLKAVVQYTQHAKVTKKLVRNGKRVKENGADKDTTVEINGVVTWFPGDQNAFANRGGTTVASTKDFSAQMPCVFLGCKKWLQDNRAQVEKFILAASLGGDQVKSHSTWLTFASQVADKVYADGSMKAKDWENAFKGISMTDVQGNINEVGGSRVFNLADQAEYFGLNGSTDKYNAVYTTFGDLDVKAFPELVPNYPKYEDVVDLSYVMTVWTKNKSNSNMTAASVPTFKEGATMSQLVSAKSVSIEFDVNSATIKPESYSVLEGISKDLIIAENLLVSIEGHTDNTGNPDANQSLSEQRAASVKGWLQRKDPKIFKNKITSYGYGSSRPVDPNGNNNSPASRKKNRRVEIKLGR